MILDEYVKGRDITGIAEDLSEYLGRNDIVNQLLTRDAARELAIRWDKSDIDEFYTNSEEYLIDLAQFNLRADYLNRISCAGFLRGKRCDFGGGIGTLAILLKMEVYVDVPSPQRKFAEWRFKKHGLDIEVRDNLKGLKCDGMSAIDVMEHIHPLRLGDVVKDIANSCNMFMEVSPFKDPQPMHFDNEDRFNSLMRIYFTGGSPLWKRTS